MHTVHVELENIQWQKRWLVRSLTLSLLIGFDHENVQSNANRLLETMLRQAVWRTTSASVDDVHTNSYKFVYMKLHESETYVPSFGPTFHQRWTPRHSVDGFGILHHQKDGWSRWNPNWLRISSIYPLVVKHSGKSPGLVHQMHQSTN